MDSHMTLGIHSITLNHHTRDRGLMKITAKFIRTLVLMILLSGAIL